MSKQEAKRIECFSHGFNTILRESFLRDQNIYLPRISGFVVMHVPDQEVGNKNINREIYFNINNCIYADNTTISKKGQEQAG